MTYGNIEGIPFCQLLFSRSFINTYSYELATRDSLCDSNKKSLFNYSRHVAAACSNAFVYFHCWVTSLKNMLAELGFAPVTPKLRGAC